MARVLRREAPYQRRHPRLSALLPRSRIHPRTAILRAIRESSGFGRFLKKRNSHLPPEFLRIENETRHTTLADKATIADTSATRRKGLLGRKELPLGEGLWIVPCQGVHCWGMQFPIDVVYLDRRKKVCKLRRALQPWGLSFGLTAHSVLELPAGTIDQTRTERGDLLQFTFFSEAKAAE